jgi:hypothetical protein
MIKSVINNINNFVGGITGVLFNYNVVDECRSYYYANNEEYYEDEIEDLFVDLGQEVVEVKLIYNVVDHIYVIHTDDKEITFILDKYIGLLECKHLQINSSNVIDKGVDYEVDVSDPVYDILYFAEDKEEYMLSQRI